MVFVRLSETWGSCIFSYMLHKNVLDRSDRKSGKWYKDREKSGNFVMKIKWQTCYCFSADMCRHFDFCKGEEV